MRIVARLFVLLPLLWVERVWAVDCPSGSYQLTTQSDVSALAAANCDTVTGNLIIGASSDIYNLDSLTSLRHVGGDLRIRSNLGLLNIDGLLNVTEVVGLLLVDNNTALTNVDGLVGITSAGSLLVTSNPKLRQINGLSNLASTSGDVTVSSNAVLQDVDGLSKLSAIVGALRIQNNPALTNIDGLAALRSVEVGVPGASYTVSASASTGGSISPALRTVETGQRAQFTLTNDAGYSLNSIGGTCPTGSISGTTYTTGAIASDCTVLARFIADGVNAEYCVGAPSGVVCDPDADGRTRPGGNMDSWVDKSWGFENTPIPNGKTVAFPFTANGGASNAEGDIWFANNMPDLSSTGYQWKGWFSEKPGGEVLNDNAAYCQRYSQNPNPTEIRWSQSSVPNRFSCDLGVAERLLYFNMAIGCFEEIWGDTSESDRLCTVGAAFPGIGGYSAYYIKVYPR